MDGNIYKPLISIHTCTLFLLTVTNERMEYVWRMCVTDDVYIYYNNIPTEIYTHLWLWLHGQHVAYCGGKWNRKNAHEVAIDTRLFEFETCAQKVRYCCLYARGSPARSSWCEWWTQNDGQQRALSLWFFSSTTLAPPPILFFFLLRRLCANLVCCDAMATTMMWDVELLSLCVF